MNSFPFSRRKFLSLSSKYQHKWIAKWLRSQYTQFLSTQWRETDKNDLLLRYTTICSWFDCTFTFETPANQKEWVEFLADRFHFHVQSSGIQLAEHEFLPLVRKGDKLTTSLARLSIKYRVALDNVRSAFNVGSILRTCDAAGWQGVIFGGSTPDHRHPKVQKTSMGTTEWVPTTHQENLTDYLKKQQESSVSIIALETVENATEYHHFQWPEKGILVVGNEEYGIRNEILQLSQNYVTIPMQGRKNSLNVANAFAVIAFCVTTSFVSNNSQHDELNDF